MPYPARSCGRCRLIASQFAISRQVIAGHWRSEVRFGLFFCVLRTKNAMGEPLEFLRVRERRLAAVIRRAGTGTPRASASVVPPSNSHCLSAIGNLPCVARGTTEPEPFTAVFAATFREADRQALRG